MFSLILFCMFVKRKKQIQKSYVLLRNNRNKNYRNEQEIYFLQSVGGTATLLLQTNHPTRRKPIQSRKYRFSNNGHCK